MKTESYTPWEEKLKATAAAFIYPVTPDVSSGVRQRLAGRTFQTANRRLRLILVALAIAILLAGMLAVPGIRAQIVEFIQIGVVRIFPNAPTAIPTLSSPVASQSPTPLLISSLRDLAGETTLRQAQESVKFSIRLPAYPPDLGQPDHVFLQTGDGQMLVLAWIDPTQSSRVRLSLEMITGSYSIEKFQPTVILETTVNGHKAVWAEGPYWFQLHNRNFEMRQIVEGNTLIWTEGDITYRLETSSSLEEAVKIAESLK